MAQSRLSPEELALINKEQWRQNYEIHKINLAMKQKEAIEVIKKKFNRTMNGSTISQISIAIRIFEASPLIKRLFDEGEITWNQVYKKRGINKKNISDSETIANFEKELLESANTSNSPTQIKHTNLNEREFSEYINDLQKKIEISSKDDFSRRERLEKAPKNPKKTVMKTTIFMRNPDVIAEALLRASGSCENCKQPAPFVRRSNNTPYLEVHHVISLASGGEDSLDNVLALCPNCHREKHYG